MTGRPVPALVTGCAGFLGSHLCESLLADGHAVRGLDSFTDYYPRAAKEANLAGLRGRPAFEFLEADLCEANLDRALDGVEIVFHLAAQPGVRLSFGPGFEAYLRDNVQATQRLLAAAAGRDLRAFVYASSSSVYGDQDEYPARESSPVRPVSPYGATKVITEQLAACFWRSVGVPVVGLRYFTVYGPRQRPDMAFSRFVGNALRGRPLMVLGDGSQVREFTYVQDVVQATIAAAAHGERGSVYNIGGGRPASLREVISLLQKLLGVELAIDYQPPAKGDPRRTEADISRARRDLGFAPATSLEEGLVAQIGWLRALGIPAEAEATWRSEGGAPRHRELRAGWRTRSHRRAPRILAYSHDGYGLGHLRRNLRLVSALRRRRPDVEVLLATGARSAEQVTGRFGVDFVALPPVVKVGNGRYVAGDGDSSLPAVLAQRSAVLAQMVRDFRPDLLLVDRYPSGMHGELAVALELHARQQAAPAAVLGLRDILDAPARIRDEWQANDYTKVIAEHYSSVLCYGDRDVFDPVAEYQLPDEAASRIEFTGYLADDLLSPAAPAIRLRHAPDERLAVCTVGGGKDAAPIARSFMAAMRLLADAGWRGVLITGPYMAEHDVDSLRRHPARRSVEVIPVADDVPSYLAAADAVVCMGGYNTTCEVLALAVPAVIVPRVAPRVEQLMRAERLGERRLVHWLDPGTLSADGLAGEIKSAAGLSRPALAARVSTLSHHGILAASDHLASLMPSRRSFTPDQAIAAGRGEAQQLPSQAA